MRLPSYCTIIVACAIYLANVATIRPLRLIDDRAFLFSGVPENVTGHMTVEPDISGLSERLLLARRQYFGIGAQSDARFRRFRSTIAATWKTQTLDLTAAGLGPLAADVLVEELLGLPPSHRPWLLHLDRNMLGDAGAVALARLLRASPTTQSLSASSNCIGPRGALEIFEALLQDCSLTSLDLSSGGTPAERNVIARGHERPAITALAKVLQRSPALSILRLGATAIGPEAAAELSAALPLSSSLMELSLPSNGLGPAGAAAIAEGAAHAQSLETLNLTARPCKTSKLQHSRNRDPLLRT